MRIFVDALIKSFLIFSIGLSPLLVYAQNSTNPSSNSSVKLPFGENRDILALKEGGYEVRMQGTSNNPDDIKMEMKIHDVSKAGDMKSSMLGLFNQIKQSNPNATVSLNAHAIMEDKSFKYSMAETERLVTSERRRELLELKSSKVYNPSHLMEVFDKKYGHLTTVKDIGIGVVRFFINNVAVSVALILVSEPLMVANASVNLTMVLSAGFAIFNPLYQHMFDSHISSEQHPNKAINLFRQLAHLEVMGLKLETMFYFVLLELGFSAITPLIYASFGYIIQDSLMHYWLLGLALGTVVAIFQGVFEKAFSDDFALRLLKKTLNQDRLESIMEKRSNLSIRFNLMALISSFGAVTSMQTYMVGGTNNQTLLMLTGLSVALMFLTYGMGKKIHVTGKAMELQKQLLEKRELDKFFKQLESEKMQSKSPKDVTKFFLRKASQFIFYGTPSNKEAQHIADMGRVVQSIVEIVNRADFRSIETSACKARY
ncbi:MAG: hypothetical protein AB8E15_09265 [Bdellovibrionales bacterium]